MAASKTGLASRGLRAARMQPATIIIALFAGLALPVTAVQILWINLVTAVTLGLALAFEPSEDGTMQRPPRRRETQ